jgi:anti-sigma regulatory factor (Ser/Thr protein kinase)
VTLDEGAGVLLFSDGLVESRERSLTQGLDTLTGLARELTDESDPATWCDIVVDALVGTDSDDDVTLLLVRRQAREADSAPSATGRRYFAETVLAPDARSARAARRFVAEAVSRAGVGPGDGADALLLCVSELVTNAVRHARTPARLAVLVDGSIVRVSVSDSAPGAVVTPGGGVPAGTEPHGRGLVLVDALADRWGVEADEHAKTVWCEVAVSPPAVGPPAPR